ncbi:LysR family transcriptional regulator [Modestobacter roseus]|uniref:DNA-binding transcriptional LysR family regulator n=1 Tax=Modestobacter roseus TaxID=1181884 RepID=A0A562IP74_9ACTN|nr:LysR family transcriptional regulator [Modestobacter roseus]MQA34401.1 LysR family transcriptional regulator [Modestobacter roseus]TWH72728.1 DNA-binding transcriptional LysR family regulator [Modestobacter roseus]
MTSSWIPPSFTLRQLAYLVAAAEAGTIAQAAERMHVSPSTMSDAITELERLLGTRLCVRRKSQGLTLTSAGDRAVADARRLLRDAQELQFALGTTAGELVGPLAIGCYPTLAPTVLPPLLSAFSTAHPQLDITVTEATQDLLVELLDSGRIDVAFVYDVQLPARVHRTKLFELPPHILLAGSHPLAREPFVRLEQLADEDFIMIDSPPSSTHMRSIFDARGITPRVRHRTQNPDVVRTLVGRGLGYGMLIQRLFDYSGATGFPVVMKDIVPAVPPLAVDLAWSTELPLTSRTEAVVAFARAVAWPEIPAVPET